MTRKKLPRGEEKKKNLGFRVFTFSDEKKGTTNAFFLHTSSNGQQQLTHDI